MTRIEFCADEDVLTENRKPRDFEPKPEIFAERAIAGGHTQRQKPVEKAS